MQIAPPYGYKEIVPFLKTHKVKLLSAGEVPEFARGARAMPISFTEFQLAAREYPIVFTSADGGKSFAAVAVLGMVPGENLFCTGSTWASRVYMPAYARRYPFCMARVIQGEAQRPERLICVEKSTVEGGEGEAMFDGEGKPTERWSTFERLLSEYEADLERTREMCELLSDYKLLEPFTLQANLGQAGGALNVTGMHRVSEKNLQELNAPQIKNLMRKGILARVYVHLLSLENFARLIERKTAQAARAA